MLTVLRKSSRRVCVKDPVYLFIQGDRNANTTQLTQRVLNEAGALRVKIRHDETAKIHRSFRTRRILSLRNVLPLRDGVTTRYRGLGLEDGFGLWSVRNDSALYD